MQVFRGFGFSTLKRKDLAPPPAFSLDRIIREILFTAKVLLNVEGAEDSLISIGKNLLYASALVDISKDAWRRAWERPSAAEVSICDEVNVLLTRYLEKLAVIKDSWRTLCVEVKEKGNDAVWASKYPLDKFVETTKRMELPFQERDQAIQFQIQDFQDCLYKLRLSSDAKEMIEHISKFRKDTPEFFHFETPFNSLPQKEKEKLLGLLQLTVRKSDCELDPSLINVVFADRWS